MLQYFTVRISILLTDLVGSFFMYDFLQSSVIHEFQLSRVPSAEGPPSPVTRMCARRVSLMLCLQGLSHSTSVCPGSVLQGVLLGWRVLQAAEPQARAPLCDGCSDHLVKVSSSFPTMSLPYSTFTISKQFVGRYFLRLRLYQSIFDGFSVL